MATSYNLDHLKAFFVERRGDPSKLPDASIAIPVNAQGDLDTVLGLLADIAEYKGTHTFEVVLAINNYPEHQEPPEVQLFRSMGIVVESIPSVRRADEMICFSARMSGIRAARTDYVLTFDADCHLPNSTALIDWYIDGLHNGTMCAYTAVRYIELKRDLSVYMRMLGYRSAGWVKRELLGLPTTRGCNYAVNRTKMMDFYGQGFLSDELNVGPTFKAHGLPVRYSGKRQLTVLTSGRVFRGGWRKLVRYWVYRLGYNLKMLPVGSDVKGRVTRGDDNIRVVRKPSRTK